MKLDKLYIRAIYNLYGQIMTITRIVPVSLLIVYILGLDDYYVSNGFTYWIPSFP